MSYQRERDTPSDARQALATFMQTHELTIDALFVPWSASRNAKATPTINDRSLNWRITLTKAGRPVVTTDYSAGIGHCPSYSQREAARPSLDYAEKIARETETGLTANLSRKRIQADTVSMFASLVQEADVIDHPTFESWARDLGYDVDSRKAETLYRACLEIGLALRAALGDILLQEAQTLAREL